MCVWIVNLKDNRDIKPKNSTKSKFEICKGKSVIAFGWAVDKDRISKSWEEYKEYVIHHYNDSQKDVKAFQKAVNAFEEMKPGDYVWTRDPEKKEYYICEILSDFEPSVFRTLEDYDISVFRNCKYKKVGLLKEATNKISWRNLISRSTARKINNPAVIAETKRLVGEI